MWVEPAIGCLCRGQVDAAVEMSALGAEVCADMLGHLQDLLTADETTLEVLRPICDPVAGVEAFVHTQGGAEMIYAGYVTEPDYMMSFRILYAGWRRDRKTGLDMLAAQRLRLLVG